MPSSAEQIAEARARLEALEAEAPEATTPASVPAAASVASSGEVPEAAPVAASSPAPEGTDVPASAPVEPEPAQAEAHAEPESPVAEVVADAAPVVESALDALAKEKAANPGGSFTDHLKALADKGLAAAVDPADESAVLRAVVQLLKEVIA